MTWTAEQVRLKPTGEVDWAGLQPARCLAPVSTLTGDLEMLAYRELQEKCRRIKGAYLHGIGGTDTHVHLALNIEPFVTISDLVQELKGASSFEVNKRMNRKALEWQRGYGVISFGKRNLDWSSITSASSASITPATGSTPDWKCTTPTTSSNQHPPGPPGKPNSSRGRSSAGRSLPPASAGGSLGTYISSYPRQPASAGLATDRRNP